MEVFGAQDVPQGGLCQRHDDDKEGGDDDVDGEEVYVNADNDDEEGDSDGDDNDNLGQKTSGRVTVFHVCDAHSRI